MELKKIDENLKDSLAFNKLTVPNELQQQAFSKVKSGSDVVVASPKKSGKTTTIVINAIQKLRKPYEQSPRVLIMVQDKPQVLEMLQLFSTLGKQNNIRAYGVHEKTDGDEDKNEISEGIDVLIGTPNKLNFLFSTAGYDVNQLQQIYVDDADILFKNRMDLVIYRLSESIGKAQRIFFCNELTEKVEIMADRILIEPEFIEVE